MYKRMFRKTKKDIWGDFPDSVISETTERQVSKRLCSEGINETMHCINESFYRDLVWEVEMLQASECVRLEDLVGEGYRCTCILPESLSIDDLQALYDKLRSTLK